MMTWIAEWNGEVSVWLANQVFVRGSLVLLAAWLATKLLRRSTASARHSVWLLALGVLVVGPILSSQPPSADGVVERNPSVVVGGDFGLPGQVLLAPTVASPTVSGGFPTAWRPTVPPGLIWVWALGAVYMLVRLGSDVRIAEALAGGAGQADGRAQSLLAQLRASVGLRRPVGIGVHPEISVPIVVGDHRPLVLLPADAVSWPIDQLRSAVRHELAHVVRHDYLVHLLSNVVLALYWPTPLACLARRHLERERESACDDRVIAWGATPTDYAQHLLNVARAACKIRLGSAAALSGRGWGLADRVSDILAGKPRRPWTALSWALGIGLALGVALATSSVSLVTTQRDALRQDASHSLSRQDGSDRLQAAWMLGALESRGDLGALESALVDRSPELRVLSAWALGEIKHPASLGALVKRLDDPDPLVREMAVLAIGELERTEGVEALLSALDRHAELREPVRWSLLQIGGVALLRLHDLFGAGDVLPHPEVWSGGRVPRHPAPPDDIAALIDLLGNGSPELAARAAIALGRLGDQRAVGALIEVLGAEDPGLRAATVWALDEINPAG